MTRAYGSIVRIEAGITPVDWTNQVCLCEVCPHRKIFLPLEYRRKRVLCISQLSYDTQQYNSSCWTALQWLLLSMMRIPSIKLWMKTCTTLSKTHAQLKDANRKWRISLFWVDLNFPLPWPWPRASHPALRSLREPLASHSRDEACVCRS
jgi:hypothetical protein